MKKLLAVMAAALAIGTAGANANSIITVSVGNNFAEYSHCKLISSMSSDPDSFNKQVSDNEKSFAILWQTLTISRPGAVGSGGNIIPMQYVVYSVVACQK